MNATALDASQKTNIGTLSMPEIDLSVYEKLPPTDLEARRRALITKAAGQHDNLTIEELHELAGLTGVLRRRASGPPKAAKLPRAAKAAKPTIMDLA